MLPVINRWDIPYRDSDWLISPLMNAVSCLPRLTELVLKVPNIYVPLGLFVNLSHLRSLELVHGFMTKDILLPMLSELFARLFPKILYS
jgi:hypothetical protein